MQNSVKAENNDEKGASGFEIALFYFQLLMIILILLYDFFVSKIHNCSYYRESKL